MGEPKRIATVNCQFAFHAAIRCNHLRRAPIKEIDVPVNPLQKQADRNSFDVRNSRQAGRVYCLSADDAVSSLVAEDAVDVGSLTIERGRMGRSTDPRLDAYAGARAMITGGLGLIGSAITRRLVSIGAEVLLVDSMIPD